MVFKVITDLQAASNGVFEYLDRLPVTTGEAWLDLLRETASRDLPTARRLALLRLVWQEACLTRESLITRVEILLERDCFGQSPQDTFHRDMAVVRQALAKAGHRLVCSRGRGRTGYYIEGRPSLDERMQQLIVGAAAEVDPRQIAVSRRLSPAQRFQQGRSMTELAEWVEAYRLRQRQPELSEGATRHVVQEKGSPEMTEASMELADFMHLVLDALEAAGVEYMITGAVAVWAWGEARTTRDFDIVVNVPIERMQRLSEELEKRDMLVPADIILDLFLETRADLPVNAIHLHTGYKAELFLLRPGDEYRATAFARRRRVDLGPPLGEVYVHAPEDLILNKLHYFSLSHQPKHVRDITSVLLTLGDELDLAYIEAWAQRLNLTTLWDEVQRRAQSRRGPQPGRNHRSH